MPYLGSYAINDYLTFAVNTHNNKGQARDADAVPSYRVYEDETTAPILTGNMALLDGSNTVGFYSEQIQLTSASGFELGKIYTIYITATVQNTVGTISHIFQMGAKVDVPGYVNVTGTVVVTDKTGYSLSTAGIDAIWDDGLSNNNTTGTAGYALTNIQDSVNNLALVGSPSYEAPTSYVLSTGTQTGGTYANVDTSNGVYHVHTDVGGLLSLYYEYSLKSDEQAVSVLFKGRINGSNDSVYIEAYDWTNTVWLALHTLVGVNTTVDTNVTSALVGKYTGTGVNAGKVRIRFVNAVTLSTATLYIDQMIIGKTITNRSVGYQDALIWVNTNGSNTNTVAYIDGVADNPVSTIAAAYTLAASTGLKGLRFLADSTVTLTQSAEAWRFVGAARINLGGQSIEHAVFRDSYTVSGTSTGEDAVFMNCGIGTSTLHHSYFTDCKIKGTITLVGTNEYFFDKCIDAVSNGTATMIFSSGTNAYLRDWRGGIQINGLQAGCECIIDGAGRVIIDPTCVGGSLTIRGHFPEPTGLSAFLLAGGTYTDNARWAEDQSTYSITDGYVTVTGTISSTITGYVQVTGTVVASSVVGDVGGNVLGTVQSVVDGYVTVTGTVVASSVTNPVTVSGYVQVTGTVNANMIQISGDAVAADNLETAADGGLYNLGGGAIVAASVTADVGITQVGADKVWASAARTLTSFGTLVADVVTAIFVDAVEGTVTFRQWTRRVSAVLFGKSSGGGVAGSKKFRNLGDTLDRVDAVTDTSGNRTGTSFNDT